MSEYIEERNEKGFTLIELLVAIVVVGILTAVAIVGINGLTNKGKDASCQATLDASRAAVAVHYANNNAYPANFTDMTSTGELQLQGGVTKVDGPPATLSANGWTITLGANGALTAAGSATCQ